MPNSSVSIHDHFNREQLLQPFWQEGISHMTKRSARNGQATYSKFKCSLRHIGKREDPGDEVVYEQSLMSSGITERGKYPNARENCHARSGERRRWLISTRARVRRSLYYP